MFQTKLMASVLSAACVLSTAAVPAASASVVRVKPVAHFFMGTKTVHFTLSNKSSETISVTVGEQAMTIAPGKTADVKAAVGLKVVNVNETKNHKAGEVLTEVSKDLSDATLSIS